MLNKTIRKMRKIGGHIVITNTSVQLFTELSGNRSLQLCQYVN